MGRKPTPVDPDDEARWSQLGVKRIRAMERLEVVSDEMDRAILEAYQKGTPTLRIAGIFRTSRATVRAALKRQGISAE